MEQDQIELGKLIASVEGMAERLDRMSDRVAKLEEMAHRGRGAMWAIMTLGAIVGGLITWSGTKAIHKAFSALIGGE